MRGRAAKEASKVGWALCFLVRHGCCDEGAGHKGGAKGVGVELLGCDGDWGCEVRLGSGCLVLARWVRECEGSWAAGVMLLRGPRMACWGPRLWAREQAGGWLRGCGLVLMCGLYQQQRGAAGVGCYVRLGITRGWNKLLVRCEKTGWAEGEGKCEGRQEGHCWWCLTRAVVERGRSCFCWVTVNMVWEP